MNAHNKKTAYVSLVALVTKRCDDESVAAGLSDRLARDVVRYVREQLIKKDDAATVDDDDGDDIDDDDGDGDNDNDEGAANVDDVDVDIDDDGDLSDDDDDDDDDDVAPVATDIDDNNNAMKNDNDDDKHVNSVNNVVTAVVDVVRALLHDAFGNKVDQISKPKTSRAASAIASIAVRLEISNERRRRQVANGATCFCLFVGAAYFLFDSHISALLV